jgi:hypothetical protein
MAPSSRGRVTPLALWTARGPVDAKESGYSCIWGHALGWQVTLGLVDAKVRVLKLYLGSTAWAWTDGLHPVDARA